jgi:Tol biopolymer transport system component
MVTAASTLIVLVATGAVWGADATQSPAPSGVAPVGASIAYDWIQEFSGGEIYLMNDDGSDARPLFDDLAKATSSPDWSPDGSRLVFEVAGYEGGEIWLAGADGTDPKKLFAPECPPACGTAMDPSWSPDGEAVAFATYLFGDDGGVLSSIEVADVASGQTRVVHQAPARTILTRPSWSPDGASIAYQATSFPDGNIEQGSATGSAIEIVAASGSGEPLVLTDPELFAAYPDWGPHDTIVFSTYDLVEFQQTEQASNLFTIRPDGSGLEQVSDFAGGEERAAQPTWTPDGERILFTLVDPSDDSLRRAAFIDAEGGDSLVLSPAATNPRMQPVPD